MSFKEKSAWVMLLGLSITGFLYFAAVYSGFSASGDIPRPSVGLLAKYTIVLVALSIFGHVVIALINTRDAEQAEDERDKAVVLRAGNWSGNLLGAGVLLGLLGYLFVPVGAYLFYLILATFWLANIAEYALQLYYYRAVI